MKAQNYFKPVVISIVLMAVISISFKIKPVLQAYDSFLPKEVFNVHYVFFSKGNNDHIFIKSFMPQTNKRQKIVNITNNAAFMSFDTIYEGVNKRIVWRSKIADDKFYEVDFSFDFKGKAKEYQIADNIPLPEKHTKTKDYLKASKYIEVHDSIISSIADSLVVNTTDLKSRIKKLYNYVYRIPSAPIKDVTSAVTTVNQNRASCNGKSRLLVALCRNQGIPARLVGGLILTKSEKRTSHLWLEIKIENTWIPFDALNGHFAYIPANYLELYRGDHFLITRTPNILFDYEYKIKKQHHIPLFSFNKKHNIDKHPVSFIKLSKSGVLPQSVLNFLLLLPIGGLLISLLKNVVGLKTYGTFLPVLIAYALTSTGYLTGIALFILIVSIVALLSFPLNKWGLLYTPKIVIILTVKIIILFVLIHMAIVYNLKWILALSFFPIIITAVIGERFARAIDEDGYVEAGIKMFQTLIVTSFCYLVFNSLIIKSLLTVFPELIFIALAANLLLGKWIGLRLMEYFRFKFIIK